jgi:hypothetical protein
VRIHTGQYNFSKFSSAAMSPSLCIDCLAWDYQYTWASRRTSPDESGSTIKRRSTLFNGASALRAYGLSISINGGSISGHMAEVIGRKAVSVEPGKRISH